MQNSQNPTILILGASGTIGKQVVLDLEILLFNECHIF